ncbi:hypothetical protein [Streptomyces olivaceus]|uniref:hypothetical protein n=1 Tax=Streptomyces olivaceus TaxID=47716 RepID=UPI002ADE8B9C|nr:hypothetical protein [Streptomyces olivaceus]
MVVGSGPGEASARLVLLQGVSLLRPEDAVFEAMLEGVDASAARRAASAAEDDQ